MMKMEIDWSSAPDWANFAAYDHVRGWAWRETRPIISGHLYYGGGDYESFNGPELIGDWKDSLYENPKGFSELEQVKKEYAILQELYLNVLRACDQKDEIISKLRTQLNVQGDKT